jgi:glycosyltransferase involved in cell wall biosynthesis
LSRFDVFVPCYNYGRFVRQCVESVLKQEGVEVRVLILDDASQDDSESVGRQLAREDSRVEYRRHAVNRGHIDTYNEGIAWAGGDYCLLLSADDLLTLGSFSRVARLMDAHPEVGFTYGRAIKTSEPDRLLSKPATGYEWRIVPGMEFFKSICKTGENVVDTATAVVRTSLQKRIGGYVKELPHAGDMEMWLRCSLHASIGYIDAEQAYYRLHGSSMSVDYKNIRDLEQRRRVFDILFEHYGDRIANRGQVRRAISQALGNEAFWAAHRAFDDGRASDCKDYLAFANATHRSIRFQSSWWRMRAKQMAGQRLWFLVRPWIHRLRGIVLSRDCPRVVESGNPASPQR